MWIFWRPEKEDPPRTSCFLSLEEKKGNVILKYRKVKGKEKEGGRVWS